MLTNTSGKSEKMTDSKIYLDTAIFIYYLEQNQFYFNKTRNFFKLCFNNENIGLFTSAVTIEEYCVFPVSENNAESIENFDKFIDGMDISVIPVSRTIALEAAKFRAKYKGVKALDAIHLATAYVSGCSLFVTNDKQLKQIQELNVVTMDDDFFE